MNSNVNPQDDDGGFWSFMKTVVEISAELLVTALLLDEQEEKVGKSLVFKFGDDDDAECSFKYSPSGETIWLENESQTMTCSCTFVSVGNDGQPHAECLFVGPGSKQDVTSLVERYKEGTCALCAYVPSADTAVGGSFKISPWVKGMAVGATLVMAGIGFVMIVKTMGVVVTNNTRVPWRLRGSIAALGFSFEFQGSVAPSNQTGNTNGGQLIPFPNDVTLEEGDIIPSLMLEIGTEDVAGVRRAASASAADDTFGPYYLKFVGAHCSPEMALTAAGDHVYTMPLEAGNDNQQWALTPVFVNAGSKFYGFRIGLQSDPLNTCLKYNGNNQPLGLGAYGHGSAAFIWVFAPSKDNNDSVLIEPYSDLGQVAVDVPYGSCNAGTVVQAYNENDTLAQQWQFST
jgi:hypothetical protein